MSLTPGARLGPYEVVSLLGAGGMGEVFKARDTRLERSVAIKVLPAEFAQNSQLRLRFEREAKAISQLSHPNICAVYDVGENYIVMELLEGETLAERVARGSLPLDQLIRIGSEIAHALDRAHKAGIAHRDLKPSNVMLTKSGAKLLDFGLAKETGASVLSTLEDLRTAKKPLTEEGVLIGTFQYMAPEQLEGGPVDARTDIFALGAVLYEMATGRRAFTGSSKASLIVAILTSEPQPIAALLQASPPALDRLIKTCLSKDPDQRWQSAGDVAMELRWITERQEGAVPHRRSIVPWLIAALVVALVAIVALTTILPRRTTSSAPIRFVINPPPNSAFNFAGRDAGPVIVSPDGSQFAFVATSADGLKRLYVRGIESIKAEAMAGTDGASYPFWSADGQNIGFFADGKMKRVPMKGGAVTNVCEAPNGRGGAWNREGTIVFTPSTYEPIYRVSAGGGQPSQVTTLDGQRETSHRWPSFLPDGRHFVYTHFSGELSRGGQKLSVTSLDEPGSALITLASSQAIYVEPGYLLFVRDRNLTALPFDAKLLRATGDPFPVAEQVQTYLNTGSGIFGASNTGVVAYQPASNVPISHLTWYDRGGKTVSVIGAPDDYEDPRLSPDGRRVAVTRREVGTGASNIWYYELATSAPTRFSYVPTFDHAPAWSPDGKSIVFDSNRTGANDIFVKSFGGEEKLLYHSPHMDIPTDWSADGQHVVFQSGRHETRWDIGSITMKDRRAELLIQTPANEKEGQVSPDGKWIAYSSDESGRYEIYVSRFPPDPGRWQVSSEGGTQPRWRRDGREIFFLSPDRRMMATAVETAGSELTVHVPQILFQTRARYTGERSYDVSPDGQKFLINTMVFDQSAPPVVVLVNWRH